jgi:hypothetical protein
VVAKPTIPRLVKRMIQKPSGAVSSSPVTGSKIQPRAYPPHPNQRRWLAFASIRSSFSKRAASDQPRPLAASASSTIRSSGSTFAARIAG